MISLEEYAVKLLVEIDTVETVTETRLLDDLSIFVRLGDGDGATELIVKPHNFYATYQNGRQTLEASIERCVASLVAHVTEREIIDDRDRALDALRWKFEPLSRIRQWQTSGVRSRFAPSSVPFDIVTSDFSGDIVPTLVLDFPHSLSYVDTHRVRSLGLTVEDAKERATKNMRRLFSEYLRNVRPEFKELREKTVIGENGTVYFWQYADEGREKGYDVSAYEPSLLLYPDLLREFLPRPLRKNKRILLSAPHRDALVVIAVERPEYVFLLTFFLQTVFANEPYSLSNSLFVVENGRVRSFGDGTVRSA
jgi:hypothetical protein